MAVTCLNCGQATERNYCSNCGQKTSVHRFSIKHFFGHDLVHGIFHVDKGFLFTMKELFTRPGHSIRDYIQGKRVNHFNYFATVILILTIGYFADKWTKIDIGTLFNKESVSGLSIIMQHYAKVVVFLGVPFYALAGYLIFRKSKQNYAENLVLTIYMLCGWMSVYVLFRISTIFIGSIEVLKIINLAVIALICMYVFIFYYQYFSASGYKRSSLVTRVFAVTLIILITAQLINSGLNEIGLRYFHE